MAQDGVVFEWLIGGGMLAIVGFSIATYKQVGKIKDEEEEKRSRIYVRLDEVKKVSDEKFTNKDLCKVLHEQINSSLIEIKTDVKLLLRQNDGKP